MTTFDISKRLGFWLTEPFIIETLKVEPTEGAKRAGNQWDESQFPLILERLREHVEGLIASSNCDDLF